MRNVNSILNGLSFEESFFEKLKTLNITYIPNYKIKYKGIKNTVVTEIDAVIIVGDTLYFPELKAYKSFYGKKTSKQITCYSSSGVFKIYNPELQSIKHSEVVKNSLENSQKFKFNPRVIIPNNAYVKGDFTLFMTVDKFIDELVNENVTSDIFSSLKNRKEVLKNGLHLL